MVSKNNKPPTQGVGVEGFRADVYASDLPTLPIQPQILWGQLEHIPKYQMYLIELSRMSIANIMDWAHGYTLDMINKHGQDSFFKMYCDWHDHKGYWENEDYYGNLKGDDQ